MPDPDGSCGMDRLPGTIGPLPLTAAVAGDVDALWLADAQSLFNSPQDLVDYSVRMAAVESITRKVVMSKVDSEVQELIKLAEAQGWPTPELDGTKLKWTNPEGGSVSTPTRVIGRGLNNLKTQLRRLGLEIPNPQKKADRDDAPADPVTEPENPGVADEETGNPAVDPFAALGVLTEFVQRHQTDESEWSSLCEGLEVELTLAKEQRDTAERLINDIRTALTTTAPWQALPAIAALLGLSEEKSA